MNIDVVVDRKRYVECCFFICLVGFDMWWVRIEIWRVELRCVEGILGERSDVRSGFGYMILCCRWKVFLKNFLGLFVLISWLVNLVVFRREFKNIEDI